ncbi:MAG: cell wall/surface repeat protein [Acidimicrobiaceae bacterium]|nr:cell wall/surface repeat protein [Acidimicrobiaceae bacterium]
MHVKSHLKRFAIVLLIALPLASVTTLASASTAAAATRARPGEPRDVPAIAGSNSATVRFLPPSSSGGYRVDRYDILSETAVTKRAYTCTATDCRIGGLTAGTLYFFQVAAVTKVGRGAYSLPSKVVTATGSISITFNANGGIGTMAPETEPYDATAALTPNTFTYVGYTFAGWNSKANGSGTAFNDGSLVKFNGSATFYAQWTVGSVTTAAVTFNANGGIGTMASETENLNFSAALTTDVFTRAGYSFSGWNTAASGSGTSYANGATYNFAASVTLYAQWTVVSTTQFVNASTNWSGYVVPSTSALLTDAEGEWTVPTMNCADTPNGEDSIWIGIGGVQWNATSWSGALLQTGISVGCANGVQQNSAWWEVVPANPNHEEEFTHFPITAGNEIKASVFQLSNGEWETLVSNLNTGLSALMVTGEAWGVGPTEGGTITFSSQGNAAGYSYSGGYTAEWIVEDPEESTATPGNPLYPFANFGSVTFSDLRASFSSWSLTPDEEWGIVQNGVTLATPTNSTTDGFTVSYAGS